MCACSRPFSLVYIGLMCPFAVSSSISLVWKPTISPDLLDLGIQSSVPHFHTYAPWLSMELSGFICFTAFFAVFPPRNPHNQQRSVSPDLVVLVISSSRNSQSKYVPWQPCHRYLVWWTIDVPIPPVCPEFAIATNGSCFVHGPSSPSLHESLTIKSRYCQRANF